MSWQELAACKDRPTEIKDGKIRDIFFPNRGESDARAKEFCKSCPVSQQCLDLARKNEVGLAPRFGVYGGLTADERQRLFGSEYSECNE